MLEYLPYFCSVVEFLSLDKNRPNSRHCYFMQFLLKMTNFVSSTHFNRPFAKNLPKSTSVIVNDPINYSQRNGFGPP